ncbi:hypothetical protein CsSME_00020059 [Camellia sinensis var. sinensis]
MYRDSYSEERSAYLVWFADSLLVFHPRRWTSKILKHLLNARLGLFSISIIYNDYIVYTEDSPTISRSILLIFVYVLMATEKSTPSTFITPTPVLLIVPATFLVRHGEKPEKSNGSDFKHWQQKMFYLTNLNLAKFLHEDAPSLKE